MIAWTNRQPRRKNSLNEAFADDARPKQVPIDTRAVRRGGRAAFV